MKTKDRLKEFVRFLNMGQNSFEKEVGIANGYLASKSQTISSDTIEKVTSKYPNLNLEWLLTGKGEMLKNSGVSVGNNNKGDIANNSSSINKNKINVSLPESGTQKIIKPDSTIELTSSDSSSLELESIKKDNEALRLQISHLKDNIATKDELIASLKETIELLKHRQ